MDPLFQAEFTKFYRAADGELRSDVVSDLMRLLAVTKAVDEEIVPAKERRHEVRFAANRVIRDHERGRVDPQVW